MASNQGTPVQIFGQTYRLKSDEDPERIERIARMVDRKMSRIADHGASADNFRIAVLAALELADDLAKLGDDHAALKKRVEDKSASLEALLDNACRGEPLDEASRIGASAAGAD